MELLEIKAEPKNFRFDIGSLALIMIDLQLDFLEKNGFGDRMGYDVSILQKVIEPCSKVLKTAREMGLLVIHTREGFRPNLDDAAPFKLNRSFNGIGLGTEGPLGRALIRGEAGHDIVEELYPLSNESIIDKPGHGAFYSTDLDLILRNREIKQLIICGVTTENCIQSTAREAKDRGYQCLILEDCTASFVPEFHAASMLMFKSQGGLLGSVSDAESVIKTLSSLKK